MKGKEKAAEKKKDEVIQDERAKSHLDKIESNNDSWFKNVAKELGVSLGFDWSTTLKFSTCKGLFPTKIDSYIEVEAILAMLVNEWVDLTVVFWFTS